MTGICQNRFSNERADDFLLMQAKTSEKLEANSC
jgi:hypothetical protein